MVNFPLENLLLRARIGFLFCNRSLKYERKNPFPTLHYSRKRLQRIESEQYVQGAPCSWPRSFFPNWNLVSELRSFAFRIQEPMNIAFLRSAFADSSCLDLSSEELMLRKIKSIHENNTELYEKGRLLMLQVLRRQVSLFFEKNSKESLPEEATTCIIEHLMSVPVVSKVARNLGLDDMVIASAYPCSDLVLFKAFCALVQTIAQQRGAKCVELFVSHFIFTQLIELDLFKIWAPADPTLLLNDWLQHNNRAPAEFRLLYNSSALENPVPVISIALFSDGLFLSSGQGRSLDDAKKDAAVNGLRSFYRSWEFEKPISETLKVTDVND